MNILTAPPRTVARNNALAAFDSLPLSPHLVQEKKNPTAERYNQSIRLVTKGKLVDQGKATPGNYYVVDGETVDKLGDEIDLIPLAMVHKALDVSGEEIVEAFGQENPEYQRIAEESTTPDSGCMYGPCFLVFERSTGKFYEHFFNNASGRIAAPELVNLLPVTDADVAAAEEAGIELKKQPPIPARLSVKLVQKGRKSWHVPVVEKSDAQFDTLPSGDEVLRQVNKFYKQIVTEDEGRDR